ncbi:MAG: hypothetical protein AUI10_07775 [Actinobacteria bacterium 13_2_20CM_2_72_6]|nr:MAG: hypothetical protein AUI10_07775 [Actinobacteria bacterium 13_2_20CM_2_72_6]
MSSPTPTNRSTSSRSGPPIGAPVRITWPVVGKLGCTWRLIDGVGSAGPIGCVIPGPGPGPAPVAA